MKTFLSVKLYGTPWCWLTNGFENYLRTMGIKYQRFDLEQDPEAERIIREYFGGELTFPVLAIGSVILKNPTIQELNTALHQVELL